MSMSRITVILSVLVAMSVCLPRAGAQHDLHNVPPVIHPDGYRPDYFNPFVEPTTFQTDLQFFAPADADIFGGGPAAATGWFGSYDRIRMWVSRPEYQGSYTDGDFTWGNRFDAGYMTEDRHGWLFSVWHIDGPQATDFLIQERINIFESSDFINANPNVTIILRGDDDLSGDADPLTGLPRRDRNDPRTNQRDYFVGETLNTADLMSFELNKVLRLKTCHHGSIMEPFVGFRYMVFRDYTSRGEYTRFDEEFGSQLEAPIPPPPLPVAAFDNATIEQYTLQKTRWDNHMVGGQVGLRWFKLKGRWNLSSEVRAFAFQNFQNFIGGLGVTTTYYDGTAPNDDVIYEFVDKSRTDHHDASFVFGGEVRADAAYALTRYLSLKVGMSFMEMGAGVARGPFLRRHSEDLTMIGFNFGAVFNR
jgi:hypothetical protein